MQLEEKVLRNAFPEYAAYAKRTPRLIPACGETLPPPRRRPVQGLGIPAIG